MSIPRKMRMRNWRKVMIENVLVDILGGAHQHFTGRTVWPELQIRQIYLHQRSLKHLTPMMAAAPADSTRIQEAQKSSKTNPPKAEAIYEEILSKGPGSGEAALREYETALMGLGELYRDTKRPNELANLVRTSRSTLSSFAKAKTAKLGRIADP